MLEQQAEEQLVQQETLQQILSDECPLPGLAQQHTHSETQQEQQQYQHQSDGQQHQSSKLPQNSAVQDLAANVADLQVAEIPEVARSRHAADVAAAADSGSTAFGPEQELLQDWQAQIEPSSSDKFLQELFCCPLTKVTCCCPLLLLTLLILLLTWCVEGLYWAFCSFAEVSQCKGGVCT